MYFFNGNDDCTSVVNKTNVRKATCLVSKRNMFVLLNTLEGG
jgi:hypothetical protein